MSSLTLRLERLPLLGHPLASAIRAVWRPLFSFYCGWKCYRILQDRARLVRASPDCARLPRVKNAGRIRGRHQIMHNGLRVRLGSYYGWGCVPFFRQTAGVHEPQEEIAFGAVLPLMPPNAVMLELGSYWAYYSMWFAQIVPAARNYLVEPNEAGLKIGQLNFADNGFRGHFTRAFVGRESIPNRDGTPTVNVDAFCAEQKLDRVHLLHADIQGFELEMLEGARETLGNDRVDFLFLSTHSEKLHAECRAFLTALTTLRIIVDVSPAQSFSDDGLLVAVRAGLSVPAIEVALR